MKTKQLEEAPHRSFALVLDSGDEAIACLQQFAREQRLGAAHFTGLGAFSSVVLGYYELDRKDYRRNAFSEQVELVSLIGDITAGERLGETTVHAHAVVGRKDGAALGGHLLEGRVQPTLEIMLTETPAHLRRRKDAASGLALIVI